MVHLILLLGLINLFIGYHGNVSKFNLVVAGLCIGIYWCLIENKYFNMR